MSNKEFRAMLDLFMCSDPWPVEGGDSEAVLKAMLHKESVARGYKDWIGAYHKEKP